MSQPGNRFVSFARASERSCAPARRCCSLRWGAERSNVLLSAPLRRGSVPCPSSWRKNKGLVFGVHVGTCFLFGPGNRFAVLL